MENVQVMSDQKIMVEAHGGSNAKNLPKMSYVTLFSGAGIGCHAFTDNGFECVVTNELIPKRLEIQKFNKKCKDDSGYVLGNIEDEYIKKSILNTIKKWKENSSSKDIDVVVCTPPCQGMSVANHHKDNELDRNSLVIESISLINKIKPKIFIFENVRTFLTTKCMDSDGQLKDIKSAIEMNLQDYNISSRIINFKDYGNPSQRTRTIVIGSRKDILNVSPIEFMPDRQNEKTLRNIIGKMPSLEWGEIDSSDMYHFARKYPFRMKRWIDRIKEGESAFDNKNMLDIPHTIKNGKRIVNKNKNGDKYKRCYWDVPMPCIHTRNDIMASQMTLHPEDDRVFSIRELMKLMSISNDFKWCDNDVRKLNAMSFEQKEDFLKKEELNIRRSIGESVPPVIFRDVAKKIRNMLIQIKLDESEMIHIIKKYKLHIHKNLKKFIRKNIRYLDYYTMSKIVEMSNSDKDKFAAYYTSKHACFSLVDSLPMFESNKSVSILEPSVGSGTFIPAIVQKYRHCRKIKLDLIDIDRKSLAITKLLIQSLNLPSNIKINFKNTDFLSFIPKQKYDIIVGNPPFGKITNNPDLLKKYKDGKYNKNTNNIYSFFIEHSIGMAQNVALIVPKTLLSTPEFNKTRDVMEKYNIKRIVDFGQKIFKIKIETAGFVLECVNRSRSNKTTIQSFVTGETRTFPQSYIMSENFPYWLIYRNELFDNIAKKMTFGILSAYRDRQITKRITKNQGKIRVLKSRNINSNKIIDIAGYDAFVSKRQLDKLSISKFMNTESVLIPNLTYNPRACFMPKNSICDGSVAIVIPKNGISVDKKMLKYYGTEEFRNFYMIARNKSTRSLNIDSNSIFFFGKIKQQSCLLSA